MLKKFVLGLSLGLGLACTQSILAHGHEEPTYVFVQQAPPADLEDKVETKAPSHKHIWVKGYWRWVGRWSWVKGHWAEKPHPDAEWTDGYWVKKPNRWVWVPGHWE